MHRSPLLSSTLLLLALGPSAAQASPVNPWGATVGKGVVALTPFLYVDQTPAAYPYLYAQYGFTDSFEILAGGGGTIAEAGSSVDELELMPRLFVSDSAGLALHATYTPGVDGVTLAPEYHGVYSWDPLDLTVNVGWGPWLGAGGFAPGDVYAMIAPERYLTESTSIFVELNPSYTLPDDPVEGSFYMEVVPGVGTAVNDTHFFAAGVHVPVTGFDAGDIYFGGWYSVGFGGE
jgi:hypothetical protein